MQTTRRFTCVEGGAGKFWEITFDGAGFSTRYGKVGTSGQCSRKEFGNATDAAQAAAKLVNEKMRKGYVEVGTDGAPISPGALPTASTVAATASEPLASVLPPFHPVDGSALIDALQADVLRARNGGQAAQEKYAKEAVEAFLDAAGKQLSARDILKRATGSGPWQCLPVIRALHALGLPRQIVHLHDGRLLGGEAGAIIIGDVHVHGSFSAYGNTFITGHLTIDGGFDDLEEKTTVAVGGDVRCPFFSTCGDVAVGGNLVTRYLHAYYNDKSLYVDGRLVADIVHNEDHHVECRDERIGAEAGSEGDDDQWDEVKERLLPGIQKGKGDLEDRIREAIKAGQPVLKPAFAKLCVEADAPSAAQTLAGEESMPFEDARAVFGLDALGCAQMQGLVRVIRGNSALPALDLTAPGFAGTVFTGDLDVAGCASDADKPGGFLAVLGSLRVGTLVHGATRVAVAGDLVSQLHVITLKGAALDVRGSLTAQVLCSEGDVRLGRPPEAFHVDLSGAHAFADCEVPATRSGQAPGVVDGRLYRVPGRRHQSIRVARRLGMRAVIASAQPASSDAMPLGRRNHV